MFIVSTENEGIEVHVNRYFKQNGSTKTFQDVLKLKHMQIGGKALSMQRQADELGMKSRTTLYKWHRIINKLGL